MFRRPLSLLLLLLTLAAWPGVEGAAQGSKGTKWALLVGVADYENPDVADLRFTVADVKSVAAQLVQNAGFPRDQVFTMTSDEPVSSPARPTHLKLINRLNAIAAYVKPEDTFVLYFSGHGFTRDGGRHFLGTVDADPGSLESLEASTVPVATLQRIVSRVKAQQVIFIIDACRNDPEKGKAAGDNLLSAGFSRDLVTAARAAGGGIAGTAVLLACSEGERAHEWDEKGQGVFTYYLLEALRGQAVENGQLTMSGIADYVQQRVRRWSIENNKRQTPDLVQQGAAKLVLASEVRVGQAPPEPVRPDAQPMRPDTKPMSDMKPPAGQAPSEPKGPAITLLPQAKEIRFGLWMAGELTPQNTEQLTRVAAGIYRVGGAIVGVASTNAAAMARFAAIPRGGSPSPDPRLYGDFRLLLERRDVDVVLVIGALNDAKITDEVFAGAAKKEKLRTSADMLDLAVSWSCQAGKDCFVFADRERWTPDPKRTAVKDAAKYRRTVWVGDAAASKFGEFCQAVLTRTTGSGSIY